MIDLLHRRIIPAAYDVLPPAMASDRATAMLLAIALQESKAQHRKQTGGPARSFWQFERVGVAGVLGHKSSRNHITSAMVALCEPAGIEAAHSAITHNDVLAACFARCLLWQLPDSLPGPNEPERAWTQYLTAWRPGKPKPGTWGAYYHDAWQRVLGVSPKRSTAMYQPKYNHLRDQILAIAGTVRDEHSDDWKALDRKDTTYVRRVAYACRVAGLSMVGLNGKRGNRDDLSADVLAFPNDTGCPDMSGTFPGLELHDFISAVEDAAARKLSWGDATIAQFPDGSPVPGAWITPEPVGDTPAPPVDPPTPTDPRTQQAYATLAWFVQIYDQIARVHPTQRPPLSRDEIITALQGLRDACAVLVERRPLEIPRDAEALGGLRALLHPGERL